MAHSSLDIARKLPHVMDENDERRFDVTGKLAYSKDFAATKQGAGRFLDHVLYDYDVQGSHSTARNASVQCFVSSLEATCTELKTGRKGNIPVNKSS
jgi:hypothetical protein